MVDDVLELRRVIPCGCASTVRHLSVCGRRWLDKGIFLRSGRLTTKLSPIEMSDRYWPFEERRTSRSSFARQRLVIAIMRPDG